MVQMSLGIVVRKEDAVARSRAAKLKAEVRISQDWALPWSHTLFIADGTCVPWDLLPAGFNFIQRWDAAAPLWRVGMLASMLGTPEDRKRTESITHDLRLLVYTPELLFVRNSEAGAALITTWRAECAHGDEMLAFLRALYIVKPAFCVLPRSWLANIEQRRISDTIAMRHIHPHEPLTMVEIAPGRFVRCRESEKEKVREYYKRQMSRSHRGR